MRIQGIFPAALMCVLAVHAEDSSKIQTVVADETAAVTQYLVALPHIAFGGAWRTKIVVTNASSTQADVTLSYFATTGTPLALIIDGVAVDHSAVTVPANGAREIEPDWSGPETSGWAGLNYTSSGIKVQGVFLWHDPKDPADKYNEAAAPVISQVGPACIIPLPGAATVYSMPFDETEGRFSGYGFVNTTSSPVVMTLTIYDESGQQWGTYAEQVPGFGHPVFLLKDKVPLAAGRKGRIAISGSGIVPLGFRFTPYYTFTTWQP
jgi:hypothetical protein